MLESTSRLMGSRHARPRITANGEMDAQHDDGAATQPQEQIEEESRDFKSSFCEFRNKRVKCHNVEGLGGKQTEGQEWVKSHFMPWAETSFRWRRQKRFAPDDSNES